MNNQLYGPQARGKAVCVCVCTSLYVYICFSLPAAPKLCSVLLAFALVSDFSKIFSIGSYVSQGIVRPIGWYLIDGMCATQQFDGWQLTDVVSSFPQYKNAEIETCHEY